MTWPIESVVSPGEYQLFCTVTLPKCCYGKGPETQARIMHNYLKRVHTSYFEEMAGCYELTLKGNVHAHFVGKYRTDLFSDIKFNNKQAEINANTKYIVVNLKRYSNCDVQPIKNIEKCFEYMSKELDVTKEIIKGKATFLFSKTKEREKIYKKCPLIDQIEQLNMINSDKVNTCCLDVINMGEDLIEETCC